MTIEQLIKLTENRLLYLQGARSAAWASGDADGVARLDSDIAQTQDTIAKLQSVG